MDSVSDDGGYIVIPSMIQLGYLPFHNKDIMNRPAEIAEDTKVHFEVQKRGGRSIAVRINIIGRTRRK